MRVRNLLLCFLILIAATWVYAQGGAYGTITGTVIDNSGASVTNAGVDVTNIATNVAKHTQTTSSGDFTVPYLAPGTYRVTVQSTGFQKSVVDNISLVVGQEARTNVTMKPGAVSESVTVEASAVQLDTDSSSVSQLISQKQVDQLPLNGRNFVSLLFIGAGAVQTNGEQGQMRQGEGNAISINGGRPTSNNYTLDGLINTDTALNTPAVILSQDAIQEFKVQSSNYSAEYGFSANQINIVSKSGTNQLHGTAWDFIRNDALDAKAPFQSAIPKLRQNQFGFVVGGPIYIPKVYDGRNKTFFLANYEGWRIGNGLNQDNFNTPDPAQLSGDFSASGLTSVNDGCIPSATQFCLPIDPTTGQPFPGNIIPSARFSRLANVALGANLFPAPNCTTCPGNYRLVTNLQNKTNQQTYKLDQQLGRFGSLFFRYTTATYDNENINGSVTLPFGVGVFNEKSESWMISHTMNIGSKYINNFRFGRLEPIAIQGGKPAPASDVSALGLTGVFPTLPAYASLYPTIGFQGINGTNFGSQGNDTSTSDIPTWEFADSLAMIRGKHTVSVGFDYRRWLQKRNLSADFLGNFNFSNDTISKNTVACENPNNLCGTGNSIADFLLGYYNNASTFQPGPFSPTATAGNLNQYQFSYFAPFVQDDWKVNNRLTLNLGLRWDYRAVPYEASSNKMFWFDRANAGGGLCFADKGLQTDSVPELGGPIAPEGNGFYRYCGRNNPAAGSKKSFAPRLGFAYRLTDKTVVRGGYGIFFDSAETREIDDSGDIYPFVVRASPNPTADSANCGTTGNPPCNPKLTDNMFPAVPLHQVSAAADGSQFFAVIISEFPHNPYVQQWSLSVQRELARNTTLEANYVGNKGTHLLNRVNIGQGLPPTDLAFCNAQDDTGKYINLNNGDCPASARRPFENIRSSLGFLDSQWNGYSNYHAANLKLERRTSSLALVAVYTYSKSMDDKSAAAGVGGTNAFAGHMDENNARLDYGRSDFDVPHRFVVSAVYQLPFGRGKRYANSMNKAADLALGGWQLTTITTFQKGFPFSVLANDQFGLLTTFTQRANLASGCDPNGSKSITQWFNTSCFTQPLVGQFGNSGRNIIRGPGINNWDVGVGKDFKFTERVAFQFRVESFNFFNHSQYGFDPFTSTSIGAPVSNNPNNGDYGRVVAAHPGRIVQFGGKIVF